MTPARLGLGYTLRDVQLLVDRIGAGAAREMLFTGRMFDAAEAGTAGVREPRGPGRGARRGGGRLRGGDRGQRSALDPGHQGGDRRGPQDAGGPRPGALRRPGRGVQRERGLPGRPARLRRAPLAGISWTVGAGGRPRRPFAAAGSAPRVPRACTPARLRLGPTRHSVLHQVCGCRVGSPGSAGFQPASTDVARCQPRAGSLHLSPWLREPHRRKNRGPSRR